MMSAPRLISALLSLLSLSVAAVTPPDCSQLVKPITLKERPKIFGRWILIEAFTSGGFMDVYLQKHNSIWVEMTHYKDDKEVCVSMHGKIDGECYGATTNATFINDNTFTDEVASFIQTCPECLMVDFRLTTFQALFVFGTGGSLSELDLETVRMQAECLQYPTPAAVQYDTNEELCPEKPDNTKLPFDDEDDEYEDDDDEE